jgi:hypothetical protein
MSANRLYHPSNGSEGEWFVDKYCMHCIHCDPNPDGPKQCQILCASLFDKVPEWVYDNNGKPTCTQWKKWNWEKQGNPDNPDNPNAPIAVGENQLCFPFFH